MKAFTPPITDTLLITQGTHMLTLERPTTPMTVTARYSTTGTVTSAPSCIEIDGRQATVITILEQDILVFDPPHLAVGDVVKVEGIATDSEFLGRRLRTVTATAVTLISREEPLCRDR